MNEELKLKNRLKEARMEKNMSQNHLAELVYISDWFREYKRQYQHNPFIQS